MDASTRTFLATCALVLSVAGAIGYLTYSHFRGDPAPETPVAAEEPVPTPKSEPGGGPTDERTTPTPKPGHAMLDEALAFVSAGDYVAARKALAAAFAEAPRGDVRDRILEAMLQVNDVLVYKKPNTADIELYQIRSGDSLAKIAKKFPNLDTGSIKLINRLTSDNIRAGHALRIPRGTFSCYVVKSQFRMYLMYEGCALKSYLIAVGQGGENDTPVGRFKVGVKTPDPQWSPPAKLMEERGLPPIVPANDPRNPLGPVWIPIHDDAGLHRGYGLHGTNDEKVIGTAATFGCVRLANDHAREVYGVAFPGMIVDIVE